MSEKFKSRREDAEVGGKLSQAEVEHLLEKYGTQGLKEDPEHGEFLMIGNTRIQKIKTVGMVDGKPKPIERRIKELLGLEEEKW